MPPETRDRIDALKARASSLKGRWEAGEVDDGAFAAEQAEIVAEYEAIGRDRRDATDAAPRPAPIVGERLVVAVRAFCEAYLTHGR